MSVWPFREFAFDSRGEKWREREVKSQCKGSENDANLSKGCSLLHSCSYASILCICCHIHSRLTTVVLFVRFIVHGHRAVHCGALHACALQLSSRCILLSHIPIRAYVTTHQQHQQYSCCHTTITYHLFSHHFSTAHSHCSSNFTYTLYQDEFTTPLQYCHSVGPCSATHTGCTVLTTHSIRLPYMLRSNTRQYGAVDTW